MSLEDNIRHYSRIAYKEELPIVNSIITLKNKQGTLYILEIEYYKMVFYYSNWRDDKYFYRIANQGHNEDRFVIKKNMLRTHLKKEELDECMLKDYVIYENVKA